MDKEFGYCKRCGRKLKSPAAKIRGYGDVCFSKVQNKSEKNRLFTLQKH